MGQDPDFAAFNRYAETTGDSPVNFIDGGRLGHADDYIVVNLDQFPLLTDSEAERYSHLLINAITEERAAPLDREDMRNDARDFMESARGRINVLGDSEGAVVQTNMGVAYFDRNEIQLENRAFNSGLTITKDFTVRPNTAFNPEQQRLFTEYVRLHEGAHMMLHLDEAGSDYVAARMLLREHPGPVTENLLQTVADMRAVAPYRRDEETGPAMIQKYGIECSEGITAAIANARTEPGETLEDIHNIAQTYDDMNRADGAAQVALREALIESSPEIYNPDFRKAGFSAAVQRLMESGTYDPQSREYAILEELKEASGRMEQLVERAEPSGPSINTAPRTAAQPPSPQ